jgi:hypothetical protein
MKKLTTLFLTLLAFGSFAQSEWQWIQRAGSTQGDNSYGVGTDHMGNSYVVGRYSGPSITFGSTLLTNSGSTDVFIVKYDPSGNALWAKKAGAAGTETATKVAVDAAGNSYVVGYFTSPTLTFGSIVLTSAGVTDIFIVKYDTNGNVIWARSAGSTGDDLAYSIAIDGNSNCYIVGHFLSPDITFGASTLYNNGGYDFFVAKYDPSGNPLWARAAASNFADKAYGVTVDGSDNIYITGTFAGSSISFGSTTLTNSNVQNANIFIAKLNPSGNALWAVKPDGYNSAAMDIVADASGNNYVTGYFGTSSITFGTTTLTNTGNSDMFLAKYDANGNSVWAKSAGGNYAVNGGDLALDAVGNCYVVGNFSSDVITFGNFTLVNELANNTADLFVAKYDPSGDVLWAKSAKGNSEDAGVGIAADGKGGVLITGHYYSSNLEFGFLSVPNIGATTDIYFAKIYAPQHYLNGNLYDDVNNDCVLLSPEQRLPNLFISASPGNILGMSNDTGLYSIGLIDSVNYTIQPIIPQRAAFMIQNPCPASYNISVNANNQMDTSGFDFGFDYSPCFLLRTDVSGDRKRRCVRNNTSVFYINEGLIPANGVEVHVKFAAYDIPVAASMAYVIDPSDSSLVFNIGTLNPNQSGTITILDSIACITGIAGLTQCTKVWILPVNQCLVDSTLGVNWDQSSMEVDGVCVNDTARFTIKNSGSGNMATPGSYRIYADNVLTFIGSFQLSSGDSLVVNRVSGGATLRLEADQNAGHPGHSHPRATVEACGTNGSGGFSTGQVNLASQDDQDPDVEIDCMIIRDSYDPNEKIVSPGGVTASHFVLPETSLDYIIHFQNTGNDTAYKIVVDDPLSAYFDMTTLELGVSSHPYVASIVSSGGQPVLRFTFNDINLVDSSTYEPGSHGFVKFKVAPLAGTPLGTVINNTAYIYFDFNTPVITNTAFVTLGTELTTGVNEAQALKGEDGINIYPNPFTSTATIGFSVEQQNTTVKVMDLLGNVLIDEKVKGNTYVIDMKEKARGVYIIRINDGSNALISRKIVLQ